MHLKQVAAYICCELIQYFFVKKNVYKEEIYIDSRIHSRLIGFRGRNISQIMDKYHVDLRFSKSDSSNPDLVVVYAREDATQDDVLDCIDYLEMIQQDYVNAFILYFMQIILLLSMNLTTE